MSGARVIKRNTAAPKGSATVETVIVLPFFLIVLFSMAFIIRIFYVYNTVQASLSEVARKIGNASYFYYISGLKDYADTLGEMAEEAEGTIGEQKNTLVDAFSSFRDTLSGLQSTPGSDDPEDYIRLLEDVQDLDEDIKGAGDLIESVVSDPKSELKLFLTIFARNLSYEVTNRMVCYLARGSLGAELGKRVDASGDPALTLGIKNGIKGMDFRESSVFGDSESLEFTVRYSFKPPAPFGLLPEIKLSNRVRIIAWTGGRGISVKAEDETATDSGSESDSLWMRMDQDKRYWDRGLEIENLTVEKVIQEKNGAGFEAFATSGDYPVVDAYTFNQKTGEGEIYDVFTMNPFMKSYAGKPSAIANEIKKHGKRLLECETPEYFTDVRVKDLKRIVILVVPENSEVDEAFQNAQNELEKYNIEVRLVKDYGSYTSPDPQEQDEAT